MFQQDLSKQPLNKQALLVETEFLSSKNTEKTVSNLRISRKQRVSGGLFIDRKVQ